MNKIYYACKYAPVELLAGFGMEVVRLDPSPEAFSCADACAHPNLCGFGKGIIEAVDSEHIKALILTDCCDVCRRVYDVLESRKDMEFLYLLELPHKSGTAEKARFKRELLRLSKALEEKGLHFDLKKALRAVEQTIAAAAEDDRRTEKEHITLAGAHGGKLLYDTVATHFVIPVKDSTCTGPRHMTCPSKEAEDLQMFAEVLGEAILTQPPCMRMYEHPNVPLEENTCGVVYHTVKFCDYYSFEYRQRRGEQVPICKIETDCTPSAAGQLSTRLDAFAETLHAGGMKMHKVDRVIRYAAGVDSGSTSTDAVIMNPKGEILGSAIVPTGAGAAANAEAALAEALQKAGLRREDLDVLVTTGYGRETIGLSDSSVTEITCHAKGAHFLCPQARTVIDIGGQDSKVIRIDEKGVVIGFVMNDKCAAGTGRFLDMMARTLQMSLKEMSSKGLTWNKDVTISSMCTVFAESEVVSLIADNTDAADIIHGLNKAVAGKTASLAKRAQGAPAYVMTGGVAQNKGVVKELEEKLGAEVYVPELAQLCGAIGAALIGMEES